MKYFWRRILAPTLAGVLLLWTACASVADTQTNAIVINSFTSGTASVPIELKFPTNYTGGNWCVVDYPNTNSVFCTNNTTILYVFVNGGSAVEIVSTNCIPGYAFGPTQTNYVTPGTNPTIILELLAPPSSEPTIYISLQAGLATLALSNGLPQYTYELDYSTNLLSPWLPLSQATIQDDGSAVFFDNDLQTSRFYRASWVYCH
jgi:hypothetical protein